MSLHSATGGPLAGPPLHFRRVSTKSAGGQIGASMDLDITHLDMDPSTPK